MASLFKNRAAGLAHRNGKLARLYTNGILKGA